MTLITRQNIIDDELAVAFPIVGLIWSCFLSVMFFHVAIPANQFKIAIVAICSVLIFVMNGKNCWYGCPSASFAAQWSSLKNFSSLNGRRSETLILIRKPTGARCAISATCASALTYCLGLHEFFTAVRAFTTNRRYWLWLAHDYAKSEAFTPVRVIALHTAKTRNPSQGWWPTEWHGAATTDLNNVADLGNVMVCEAPRSTCSVVPYSFTDKWQSASTRADGIEWFMPKRKTSAGCRAKHICRMRTISMSEVAPALLALMSDGWLGSGFVRADKRTEMPVSAVIRNILKRLTAIFTRQSAVFVSVVHRAFPTRIVALLNTFVHALALLTAPLFLASKSLIFSYLETYRKVWPSEVH